MSIDNATAKKDFEGWLEFKKVRPKKIEDNMEFGEIIIECIEDGSISISESKELTFALNFPIQNDNKEDVLSGLKFKPRLRVFELNSALRGVKGGDADGRIVAYVSALTGKNSRIIEKMTTEDYGVCQAIVMYFL